MLDNMTWSEREAVARAASSPVPLPDYAWRKRFCPTTIALYVRRGGKHSIDDVTIARLCMLREELEKSGGRFIKDELTSAFIDMLLDKHDGCFDYDSYLALPLLGLPIEDRSATPEEAMADCRHRVSLLVADTLAFERAVATGRNHFLRQQKPGDARRARRYRQGLIALSRILADTDRPISPPAGRDELDRILVDSACDAILPGASPDVTERLMVSMLPTYVCHDEYMFIRILQSFETIFSWAGVLVRNAIEACGRSGGEEVFYVEAAKTLLEEGLILFAMLDTMQRDSFHTFREFNEGASIVQSRSYRRIEDACRDSGHDRPRLGAPELVSDMKEGVSSQGAGDRAALGDAHRELAATDAERAARLRAGMHDLTETLAKWKNAHDGMAIAMLGEGTDMDVRRVRAG